MEKTAELFREELVNWIMGDDDVFFLVAWSLGNGIRQILKHIEKGIDNELIQAFRRVHDNYGAPNLTPWLLI